MNTSSAFSVFSSKFDTEDDLLGTRRQLVGDSEASLNNKLAALRSLSSRWVDPTVSNEKDKNNPYAIDNSFDDDEDEDEDFDEDFDKLPKSKAKPKIISKTNKAKGKNVGTSKAKPVIAKKPAKASPKAAIKVPAKPEKPKAKRIMPKIQKDTKMGSGTKGLKKILPKKR